MFTNYGCGHKKAVKIQYSLKKNIKTPETVKTP